MESLQLLFIDPGLQYPIPRPFLSQPWFPNAPFKVASANTVQLGIPTVETFIERRGLGFQPPSLASQSEGERRKAGAQWERQNSWASPSHCGNCIWGRPQALGVYCSTSRSKSFSFDMK